MIAVGEEGRFLDVMGDEDDGLGVGLMQLAQADLQLFAPLRVERAEWLVHQQHFRAGGERPGDGDALAHAAGDVSGIGIGKID